MKITNLAITAAAFTVLTISLTGCSHVKSRVSSKEEWIDTNGCPHVKTDEVYFTATTKGDAKELVEKFRASNATKTQSIGLSGLNQTTSASNVSGIITASGDAAGKMIGTAVKTILTPEQ